MGSVVTDETKGSEGQSHKEEDAEGGSGMGRVTENP